MRKNFLTEINKKIIIIHGSPDMVLLPFNLWKEVAIKLNEILDRKEIYKLEKKGLI